MAIEAAPGRRSRLPQILVSRDWATAILSVCASFALLALSLAGFAISTPVGIAVSLGLAVGLLVMYPATAPTIVVGSFLYQNFVLAFMGGLIDFGTAFDSARGANFVILIAGLGAFVLACFVAPSRLPPESRKWLLAALAVIAVVVLYFGLGAARGSARDATVYFRNTVTPLACFVVALAAASLYRIDIGRPLLILGAGAVAYGYCELLFEMDFLSLFNGDEYILQRISRQIETGYWESRLERTGFVLRGLDDVMRAPLFNIPGMGDLMPTVFRLAGPNFHPISYAYALVIIATWLMYRGHYWMFAAALPLLLVIGSKGALIVAMAAIGMKVGVVVVGRRNALLLFFAGLMAYLAGAIAYGRSVADYHVIGLLAGLRDFARNPVGQGLGFGGNLASEAEERDWSRWQLEGIADVPIESAAGVMLYQMGVGALAFFALLFALVRVCRSRYLETGDPAFLYSIVLVATVSTNAVLQEEAFYSPLALGFGMVLVGLTLGADLRRGSV